MDEEQEGNLYLIYDLDGTIVPFGDSNSQDVILKRINEALRTGKLKRYPDSYAYLTTRLYPDKEPELAILVNPINNDIGPGIALTENQISTIMRTKEENYKDTFIHG